MYKSMLGTKVVKKKGIVISGKEDGGRDKKSDNRTEQKKIIGKFGILFAIIIVFAICVGNVYGNICKRIKNDISSKHRELQQVRFDTQNVKNIVNEWSQIQLQIQQTSFNDKRSFVYDNINLDEVVFEVDRKINDQFDTSKIVIESDKEKRMIAGNFHIDVKPSTYANLVELDNFISKIAVGSQNEIYVSSKTIAISFTTSYERVIYQMIEFIKKIFPGFLIVKYISVQPATSAIKTMYYDLKFKHKEMQALVADSIRCEIEFDWIVLSKKYNESEM